MKQGGKQMDGQIDRNKHIKGQKSQDNQVQFKTMTNTLAYFTAATFTLRLI